jgi:hypothetical protein
MEVYTRAGTICITMTANRMLRWALVLSLGTALSAGCGKKPDADFPTWAPTTAAYVPSGGSNAFDDYVSAAQETERVGGSNLDRVNFFPGHKKAAEHALAAAIAKISAATSKPCTFGFSASKPFETQPNMRGWRLLGRVFAWQVEDACKERNFELAIGKAVTGSKFGFDLAGGGALQASLGLGIVDDLRRAIAPHLGEFTATQLDSLASGMAQALSRRPATRQTVAHERQNMLLGVQAVQDAFQKGDYVSLQKNFGSSAKDGIDYLQSLKGSTQKRVDYFKGFADEANTLADWAGKASTEPTRERMPVVLAKDRPWRRLSRNFFGTVEPLLAIEDETLARTRLLIVYSKLKAMALRKNLPTLTGMDAALTTDPYSGRPLNLHSDGMEFTLYSVGENLKDDGGETDESFSKPDMTLELGE